MQNTLTKTYKVSEIMEILGISKATAYAFVKNDPPFRVLRVGDTYRVLRDSFDAWFSGNDTTSD